jgi:hypothetical protein
LKKETKETIDAVSRFSNDIVARKTGQDILKMIIFTTL